MHKRQSTQRIRRRPQPYIYSKKEICLIVEAAAELPSTNGIRALTFSTLFGLIAVTGLRVSEAISLDDADVDMGTGVLTVRRERAEKLVYYHCPRAPRHSLLLMRENETVFSGLLHNRSLCLIAANG